MATLLLELLSEEIPARMQKRAASDLATLLCEALKEIDLSPGDVTSYVTPRRVAVRIESIPSQQPDRTIERKGPKVGSPERAIQGFLKSTGLTLDQAETRETPKGTFYFAVSERRGAPALEVLPSALHETISKLSWPKSMRWGDHDLRWVRPLKSILCLLGDEVVPFTWGHLRSGRETLGHRFLSSDPILLRHPDEYVDTLRSASVVVDREERRELIRSQAAELAASQELTLRSDPGLLEEVVGLVEWPVTILGKIDPNYLELPPEILTTSMRSHQKYFALEDAAGQLAPHFVVVSNMVTTDAGEKTRLGNERVLRARLADAQFFWETDLKRPLVERRRDLDAIVFQAKFGPEADRLSHKVDRMVQLAPRLAEAVGADRDHCVRACELAKCDLVTEVVGEFPELQGIVGQYYAQHSGEEPAVAQAIREHYQPQGPEDRCPHDKVGSVAALADKLDTLVGFFAIDEKPTGSKDPFALRRAALGVLRIILENRLRLPLKSIFRGALASYPSQLKAPQLAEDLLSFFADRLKVHLKSAGTRHDLISAVFGRGDDDDLTRLIDKVDALAQFLTTEDGENLLAGYRRATNILKIEEKRDGRAFDGSPELSRFEEDDERRLHEALDQASPKIESALAAESYAEAMRELARLRSPIDGFFERVTVNDSNPELRENRLLLLNRIRTALEVVADFSRIEG